MVVVNSKNMKKFNVALSFFIIGIIYMVESNDPKILDEKTVEEKDAAESLVKIQPEEALPLVLFKLGQKNTLHLPVRLQKVASNDGKMTGGTEFESKYKESEQIFFCPEANAGPKCLVPKTFDVNERLRCASEAPLVIESNNVKCGGDKRSTIYTAIYQICENDQYQFTTKKMQFYRFCYDEQNQKTLFAIHIINSPELLEAKLLLRERKVDYRMMEKNEFPFFRNQKSDEGKVEGGNILLRGKSSSQDQTPKPGYGWRKLVPSEDMALALWRKTTFQRTNTALQHEKLIILWDKISEYVRSDAIKKSKESTTTLVYTGVIDVGPAYKNNDDDQLSNIWIKVVFNTPSIFSSIAEAYYGIAIIMNNFVETEKRRHASYSKAIKEYCDQDLCVDSLSKEFEQIKGQVRCCLVNQKMLELFGEKNYRMEELRLPNINVTEDQETFTSTSEISDEQAATSIGEIKPSEVLPLILLSNRYNFKLSAPERFYKIETRNKRIVSGSDFSSDINKQQIFFCPREGFSQKCFAPRTFGRYQPLQCNEQIVPVVRKLLDGSNQCGVDNSGTLYEVIYEICIASKPYQYRETGLQIYKLCYDPHRKIILYAHHKIMSHELLPSKLMIRERNMEYEMLTDVTLPLSNQQELEKASRKDKETESPYKLQKLVPTEDMAFALWRKSTYQYVNAALQHETLIPLWNNINRYVKQNAFVSEDTLFYYFKYDHSENSIYTGVLYKKSFENDSDDKNPEIWFKVIYTEQTESSQYQNGLVILMKNSVILKKTPSSSSNTKTEENIFREYCTVSICLEQFEKKFVQVGGQVHCCKYDDVIAKKLGIPYKTIRYPGTLVIPTINHY